MFCQILSQWHHCSSNQAMVPGSFHPSHHWLYHYLNGHGYVTQAAGSPSSILLGSISPQQVQTPQYFHTICKSLVPVLLNMGIGDVVYCCIQQRPAHSPVTSLWELHMIICPVGYLGPPPWAPPPPFQHLPMMMMSWPQQPILALQTQIKTILMGYSTLMMYQTWNMPTLMVPMCSQVLLRLTDSPPHGFSHLWHCSQVLILHPTSFITM